MLTYYRLFPTQRLYFFLSSTYLHSTVHIPIFMHNAWCTWTCRYDLCQGSSGCSVFQQTSSHCSRNANLPELLYIDCGGRSDIVAAYKLYRPCVKPTPPCFTTVSCVFLEIGGVQKYIYYVPTGEHVSCSKFFLSFEPSLLSQEAPSPKPREFSGITYLVGKITFKLLIHFPLAESAPSGFVLRKRFTWSQYNRTTEDLLPWVVDGAIVTKSSTKNIWKHVWQPANLPKGAVWTLRDGVYAPFIIHSAPLG